MVRYLLQGIKEFLLLCVVGIFVAWVVVGLLQLEYVENIDRYVTDILMRHAAQQELTNDELKFLFINVGEKSCEDWAREDQSSCTLGWATPRYRLAEIICKITDYSKRGSPPRFVVIDIELSPQPRGDRSDAKGTADQSIQQDSSPCLTRYKNAEKTADLALREEVYRLLAADPPVPLIPVPLITVRPMVINPEGPHRVTVSQSILDPGFSAGNRPAPETYGNLWFASPIIQPDTDGVVRSVHVCDTAFDKDTGEAIAGIGLLGALLSDREEAAAGRFDGSKPDLTGSKAANGLPPSTSCFSLVPIEGKNKKYGQRSIKEEDKNNGWITNRIKFSRRLEQAREDCTSTSDSALRDVETVEAKCFLERDYSSSVKHRVVVIGGSYLASGDLRVTPLGDPRMPGVMVHVNAIRAFSTDSIVEEADFRDWAFWKVKLLLIGLAALSGAVFFVWSRNATWRAAILLTFLFVAAVVRSGKVEAGWPFATLEIAILIGLGVCVGALVSGLGVLKSVAWVVAILVGLAIEAYFGAEPGASLAALVARIDARSLAFAFCIALGIAGCIYFLGFQLVVSLLGLAIAAAAIFEAGSELPAAWDVVAIGTGALGLAVFVGALGPQILFSIIGAAVTAMVVLGVGSAVTYEQFLAGTVIGTFVPALAVASEGLCGVLHEIRGRAPRRLYDTEPSLPTGRSPNEPTSPNS